jgi:hypothetical protein
MRRSYVVPMRWMVIYEYEVPGGDLNLSSTKLPRPWSPWESSPSRKNPHGRTWNRTRDLIISSQKLWPLDHEALPNPNISWSNLDPTQPRSQFSGETSSLCFNSTNIEVQNVWNIVWHNLQLVYWNILPIKGKIPMVEPYVESWSSWSIVRNSDR